MSTPIAITASNGWLGVVNVIGAGVLEREGKRPADWMDGVEEPSPPNKSVAVAPACTCPAWMTLRRV